MRYKHYSNALYYILIGVVILALFGGGNLAVQLMGLGISLLFNLLPFIILIFIFFRFGNRMQHNIHMGSVISTQSADHARFTELLIRTLVCVIQADGTVDPRETQAITRWFQTRLGYGTRQIQWISDLISHALSTENSLQEICDELNQKFNYEAKILLMELVYEVALADRSLQSQESAVIATLIRNLGISDRDDQILRSIFGITQSPAETTHFTTLGLSPGASQAEIKKAYRELSKQYHPDKVHHLGPEYRKIAEEKMRKINAAYQALAQ